MYRLWCLRAGLPCNCDFPGGQRPGAVAELHGNELRTLRHRKKVGIRHKKGNSGTDTNPEIQEFGICPRITFLWLKGLYDREQHRVSPQRTTSLPTCSGIRQTLAHSEP